MFSMLVGSIAFVNSQYVTEIEVKKIKALGVTQDSIECGGFEDNDEISLKLSSGNRNYNILNKKTFSDKQ